jgi:oligopeptide transport system permease protein
MNAPRKIAWQCIVPLLLLAALGFLRPPAADYRSAAMPPSWSHLLGATPSGEDVLRLCVTSAGVTITQAALATFGATVLGTLIAFLMANIGNRLLRGIANAFAFFLDALGPLIPIAALCAVAPHIPQWGLSLAITALCWPSIALPVREEIIAVHRREYVRASIVVGVTKWNILIRHVMPDVVARLVPQSFALFSNLAALLAALEFLGVKGGNSQQLGFIIYESSGVVRQCPWYFLSATATLVIALLFARRISASAHKPALVG